MPVMALTKRMTWPQPGQSATPFKSVSCYDLRQEFTENVIEYFRYEYLAGRTPNPCIVCNRMA
jgi:hypothetical protein